MDINVNRLTESFISLVKIDSLSKEERDVAEYIKVILESLGGKVVFDSAGEKVGGNTGNLIAKFDGNVDVKPMILCGHMDTVGPGRGIKPVLKDGVIKSDGTTILGGDDKSAIAIIIETLKVLKESRASYGPLEIIFTICEEIGLLGAKYIDTDLFDADFGYILDTKDTDGIVVKAPTANNIEIKVYGKSAHAGAAPENGINAIYVAGLALSRTKLGRIDDETTCNIGVIEGGVATNIVPEQVILKGEARAHDEVKLKEVTKNITEAFLDVSKELREDNGGGLPYVDIEVTRDFPKTDIPHDHHVVKIAQQAAKNIGFDLAPVTVGGGSDSNVFFNNGVATAVLGTGMTDVHTVNESIKVSDMEKSVKHVLEIIKIHAEG
jgi:tripeptide aminopeptidase